MFESLAVASVRCSGVVAETIFFTTQHTEMF
jgi:hypothetical protein